MESLNRKTRGLHWAGWSLQSLRRANPMYRSRFARIIKGGENLFNTPTFRHNPSSRGRSSGIVHDTRCTVQQSKAYHSAAMRPTLSLAVTIPSRMAKVSQVSANRAEARARALSLYRDFYRSSPEICAVYALDVPPSTLRAKYREKFEQTKHIDDLAVLDVLLHKGRVEFQETINAWKQVPHLMKLFADEEAPAQPVTFLEKFYSGKDEGRGTTGKASM